MTEIEHQDRLLRMRQVVALIPYHPVHLYRLMKAGKFPRQIRLGPNRVAWSEREIMDWIAKRKAARDGE